MPVNNSKNSTLFPNPLGLDFDTEFGPVPDDYNDKATDTHYHSFYGNRGEKSGNPKHAWFNITSDGAITTGGDYTNDYQQQTSTATHERYFGYTRTKSYVDFDVKDEVIGTDANQTLIGADHFSLSGKTFSNDYVLSSSSAGKADKYTWHNGRTWDFADKLFGMGGNDVLKGRSGNDILSGGTGNDILEGGLHNDLLFGGAGNDVLKGGTGVDTLYGGEGNDVLFSGDVVGQSGNDQMYGGSGRDVFIISDSATGRASPTYEIVPPAPEQEGGPKGVGWAIGTFLQNFFHPVTNVQLPLPGTEPIQKFGHWVKVGWAGVTFLNNLLGKKPSGQPEAPTLKVTEPTDSSTVHIRDFNPFDDTIVIPVKVDSTDAHSFPTQLEGQWSTDDTAIKVKSDSTGANHTILNVHWDHKSFLSDDFNDKQLRDKFTQSIIDRALYVSKGKVRDGNDKEYTLDGPCCTNRGLTAAPLSPDRLILRAA